jgi:hypothetical protein
MYRNTSFHIRLPFCHQFRLLISLFVTPSVSISFFRSFFPAFLAIFFSHSLSILLLQYFFLYLSRHVASPSISVPFFFIFTFTVANWWKFDPQCLRKEDEVHRARSSEAQVIVWKKSGLQVRPFFFTLSFHWFYEITAIRFTKSLCA